MKKLVRGIEKSRCYSAPSQGFLLTVGVFKVVGKEGFEPSFYSNYAPIA